jgi:Ca2+-binding RTX toxin-like protein
MVTSQLRQAYMQSMEGTDSSAPETAATNPSDPFDNSTSGGVAVGSLSDTPTPYDGTGTSLDDVVTGDEEANHLYGLGGDDVLYGGAGNDTLTGGPGHDVLYGQSGNDTLIWSIADTFRGGGGTDTLQVQGADVVLDLRAVADTQIRDIEIVKLTGTGDNTLYVDAQEVLNISSTTDTLRVRGDAGDVVHRGGGWTRGEDQQIGENLYATYTQGDATLLVDTDVLCVI